MPHRHMALLLQTDRQTESGTNVAATCNNDRIFRHPLTPFRLVDWRRHCYIIDAVRGTIVQPDWLIMMGGGEYWR
jgi:hypothetical protein